MPRIDLAMRKWEAKTAGKGSKWKRMVTGKEDAFCKGVAEFIGVGSCAPDVLTSFREGVARVGPEDYEAAVRGKAPKWRTRYVEAMSGAR
jgi:hypothetical protein